MPPRNTNTIKPGENAVRTNFFRHSLNVTGVVCTLILAAACTKPIDVNVSTNEPVKVDLSMDVHVYQHGASAEQELAKEGRKTYKEVMTRRRDRMAEIQKLKDNRLVGESIEGLISIRNLPAGEYGTYVKTTVEDENEDRNFLIAYEAEQKDKPIPEVRRDHWTHAQRKAFPGEWIQVEDPDEPGTYTWVQKAKAGE